MNQMIRIPQMAALLFAVVILPGNASGDEEPDAEQLFRRFEDRLAEAPAVSVIYDGKLEFQNGDVHKTLRYAGAWASSPECKASSLVDWNLGMVTGMKVRRSEGPDAKPGFFDMPPNNLFIGPITRSGFHDDVLYHFLRDHVASDEDEKVDGIAALGLSGEQVTEARRHVGGSFFTLSPVTDYEFDAEDQDDVRVLCCSLQQLDGTSCPIRLWLDSEQLVLLRREIVINAGKATFTFTERYRGFSTEAIPEPFAEHQRATRSLPIIVEQGRLATKTLETWTETDWFLEGARLRALEPTRLILLGDDATVTLDAGSEFVVHDRQRRTFGLESDDDQGSEPDAGDQPGGSVTGPRDGFELMEGVATVEAPHRSRYTVYSRGGDNPPVIHTTIVDPATEVDVSPADPPVPEPPPGEPFPHIDENSPDARFEAIYDACRFPKSDGNLGGGGAMTYADEEGLIPAIWKFTWRSTEPYADVWNFYAEVRA